MGWGDEMKECLKVIHFLYMSMVFYSFEYKQTILTRVLVGVFLLEIAEIVKTWLEFSLLNAMNDFNNLVVHRGREAYFSAIF